VSKDKIINRIETLDLLRGYFLLVIILNHLYFYPSGYEYITGKSLLFASTAEGFFLISGIVLGIVRGAKLRDRPLAVATKLLLKRAWQLYITFAILVIFFTLIGWLVMENPGIKPGIFLPAGEIWTMVWQTLTLQYIYGWADYLRLYAIFIFFTPLALWLLRKQLWYAVAIASVAVWSLFPTPPPPSGWLLQPLSWQLLFFCGLIVGFHWSDATRWWLNLTDKTRRLTIGIIVPFTALTLVLSALLAFGGGIPGIGEWLSSTYDETRYIFDKDRLPPTRLFLFAIWFATFFWLFSRFDRPINKWLGWILKPFGRNSLYVYTIHAFVIFFASLVLPRSELWWYNFIVSTAVIGVIYLAVRHRFLMKIIPR